MLKWALQEKMWYSVVEVYNDGWNTRPPMPHIVKVDYREVPPPMNAIPCPSKYASQFQAAGTYSDQVIGVLFIVPNSDKIENTEHFFTVKNDDGTR